MPDIPIIDTHQHLWDFRHFRPPWLEGAGEPLERSHTPDDYARAAENTGIVRTVYMEVDVAPEQHEAEAAYVSGLCARPDNPMAAAVVGGRPAAPDFADYLDRIGAGTATPHNPFIKGVRQVLHGGGTPPGFCLGVDFVCGIRLLGARGLSFDLCLRPGELKDGAELARRCPDTRFILDHCGNGNVQATPAERADWQRQMAEIAAVPNVVACKVSGIVASARPGAWSEDDLAPLVGHTLDVFGPDRVVFGGDWPVCTRVAPLADWVRALRNLTAARSDADRRKLFHDNAVRLYALGAP